MATIGTCFIFAIAKNSSIIGFGYLKDHPSSCVCVPQNKGAAVVSPSIPAGFGEVKAKEEERLTHKFWWMGVWVKARSLHIEGCNLASPPPLSPATSFHSSCGDGQSG